MHEPEHVEDARLRRLFELHTAAAQNRRDERIIVAVIIACLVVISVAWLWLGL